MNFDHVTNFDQNWPKINCVHLHHDINSKNSTALKKKKNDSSEVPLMGGIWGSFP